MCSLSIQGILEILKMFLPSWAVVFINYITLVCDYSKMGWVFMCFFRNIAGCEGPMVWTMSYVHYIDDKVRNEGQRVVFVTVQKSY